MNIHMNANTQPLYPRTPGSLPHRAKGIRRPGKSVTLPASTWEYIDALAHDECRDRSNALEVIIERYRVMSQRGGGSNKRTPTPTSPESCTATPR